ncbi:hypothetical protein HYV43_02895 [Candidatus Micrarchaeota archaeon]|nr:hypothetical protein [Candidatus Micrarchaeota archaeon]
MDGFWLQIALSFIVGGLYIALCIRAAELFGSQWGGLIIGLPSTSLVSFAFIGLTQGTQAVVQAISIVPIAFGMNAFYVLLFVKLEARYGWKAALAASLAVWTAIMLPLTAAHPENLALTTAAGIACIGLAVIWGRGIANRKVENPTSSKTDFALRAAFAGLVIASAVYLAKTQGPIWGGMMAGFPAAFSASLVLISRKHGGGFASAVAKNMPWGNLACMPYLLVAYVLLPAAGLWIGLATAYAASLVAGLLIQRLIRS